MNEKRKFIKEYVELRGGVKELSEEEKYALAESPNARVSSRVSPA